MDRPDAVTVIRALHAAFNERDFARVHELIAADCRAEDVPAGLTYHGPDAFVRHLKNWLSGFPDARIRDGSLSGTETFGVVEFVARGTHEGKLVTRGDERLAPTHRPVELPFCEVYDLRDGLVAGYRLYYDGATLLTQLGLRHR